MIDDLFVTAHFQIGRYSRLVAIGVGTLSVIQALGPVAAEVVRDRVIWEWWEDERRAVD